MKKSAKLGKIIVRQNFTLTIVTYHTMTYNTHKNTKEDYFRNDMEGQTDGQRDGPADRHCKVLSRVLKGRRGTSDAGSQYRCGRVSRGIQPPSTS